RRRMNTEQAKQIYRQRGAVAEFPNAWIKDKLGLRKFHVRGLAKAAAEAVWACLTYNVQIWIRLAWRKPIAWAAA
ncbi:MAG: transposase, partial [Bryobacteraceae bacterium]